jgi:hypothetical protein
MINFSYLHRKWKILQRGICDFLAQRVATCLDKMTVASHNSSCYQNESFYPRFRVYNDSPDLAPRLYFPSKLNR